MSFVETTIYRVSCNMKYHMKSDNGYIWLLGATGFIGHALFRRLSANPANRLVILLHRHTPFQQFERHHTITGSLSTLDPFWLKRFPPGVIYHMARPAGSLTLTRLMAAGRGEKANQRLAALLTGLEEPPIVVYGSGSLVYGEQPAGKAANEQSPVAPVSFARYYARNEKAWLQAARGNLLDVRLARPAWIVGPGSWFRKFFWEHFVHHGMVPYYGDGTQNMSLVHIDDCARLIEQLGFIEHQVHALNILAAPPITQKEFAERMATILDARVCQISYRETCRRVGETTAKALTSSVPIQSMHGNIYDKTRLQFNDTDAILSDIIGLLKHEQGIFSETP